MALTGAATLRLSSPPTFWKYGSSDKEEITGALDERNMSQGVATIERRMVRRIKPGQLLGLLVVLIALPTTINDGIAGWTSWLSWLGEREWQWAFLAAGFLIILWSSWRRTPEPGAVEIGAAPRTPQPEPDTSRSAEPELTLPAEISVNELPPLSTAVWAERTRRNRIANLVAARVGQAQELRLAFDTFVETFLARRAEHAEGIDAEAMERAREEYGRLHRRVVAAYRRLRDHYRRFLDEEPQYDRSSNDPEAYVREEPITEWWDALTFDAALNKWANADDGHLRPYIAEERAILGAFKEWIAEPQHHDLAEDLAGVDLENEEILDLIRQRLITLELQQASRPNRAELSVRQGSIHGGESGDEYRFDVMNTGPPAVRNVRAWAAPPAGPPVTVAVPMHTLPPDNRWYPLRVTIDRRAFGEEGLVLVLTWEDEAGSHEEQLLDIRPLLAGGRPPQARSAAGPSGRC